MEILSSQPVQCTLNRFWKNAQVDLLEIFWQFLQKKQGDMKPALSDQERWIMVNQIFVPSLTCSWPFISICWLFSGGLVTMPAGLRLLRWWLLPCPCYRELKWRPPQPVNWSLPTAAWWGRNLWSAVPGGPPKIWGRIDGQTKAPIQAASTLVKQGSAAPDLPSLRGRFWRQPRVPVSSQVFH